MMLIDSFVFAFILTFLIIQGGKITVVFLASFFVISKNTLHYLGLCYPKAIKILMPLNGYQRFNVTVIFLCYCATHRYPSPASTLQYSHQSMI